MTEDLSGELNSSSLGTFDYWNKAYEIELKNFNEFGDEGEIWFGHHTTKSVIKWIEKKIEKTLKIIDLGCGNGFTCCELANEGYSSVFGIDYSARAIDLAKAVALKQNLNITYKVVDIISETIGDKFDVCIDKGTYDAISLNPIDPKEKRNSYKRFLISILAPSGIFIITSCNWTYDELKSFFTENNDFEVLDQINSGNDFKFGGKSGSTTTTLVFKLSNSQ